MKAGDNEGARKFALKKVNKEAFGLASSATAWYWSFALLDYKLKRCSGWADDYFLIFDEENHYGHDKIVGAIIRAITASPSMISFLTGNRKLPNCPIPYEMGNEASLTNVANYYMSNKELWESTPGAIEWACTNARTFFSLLFLQGDKKGCKQLKIPCTFENYKAMVEEGIYVNATIKHGKKTIHEAMSSRQPGNLKVLVDAGASVLPTLLFGVPQPIHMACYYNSSPEMIKILVDAGMYLNTDSSLSLSF